MRAIPGVVVAAIVAFLFLSYGVYESIDKATDQYLSALLTKVIPPLAAAFAGALAAYLFALNKDRLAEENKQISAGNFAVFKFHHMYTVLETIKVRYIDPTRADPNRWLSMNTPAPGFVREISFDLERLGFFLDHPSEDNPGGQLLSDLLFLGEQFRTVIGILDERGRVIGEDVIPALRKITIPSPGTPAEALQTFFPAYHHRLVGLTDELVTRVDDLILELGKLYPRIQSTLKFLLPRGNFTTLNFGKAQNS
jgi:hypothetical protein